MSLLTNVMEHSLDDGYAEAAARREAEGGGLPRTLRAKLGLAAGLVLAALVVTVGAAQARISAPVVAKEREELIDRIGAETSDADVLEQSVENSGTRWGTGSARPSRHRAGARGNSSHCSPAPLRWRGRV